MGLIAAFLIPIVLFFWFAFCLTIVAWLKVLAHLCPGNFIRAALWFNVGTAMVLWWTDKWESWDHFWPGAAFFVGLGALGTGLRYYLKWKRKRMLAMPTIPAWTPPKTPANDNQLVVFSLHAKSES